MSSGKGSICFTALVLECFLVNVIVSILRGFCLQFQISTLFDGHPDLLDEFTTFIPEAASVSAKNIDL